MDFGEKKKKLRRGMHYKQTKKEWIRSNRKISQIASPSKGDEMKANPQASRKSKPQLFLYPLASFVGWNLHNQNRQSR